MAIGIEAGVGRQGHYVGRRCAEHGPGREGQTTGSEDRKRGQAEETEQEEACAPVIHLFPLPLLSLSGKKMKQTGCRVLYNKIA